MKPTRAGYTFSVVSLAIAAIVAAIAGVWILTAVCGGLAVLIGVGAYLYFRNQGGTG